jgi:hypothetical protein
VIRFKSLELEVTSKEPFPLVLISFHLYSLIYFIILSPLSPSLFLFPSLLPWYILLISFSLRLLLLPSFHSFLLYLISLLVFLFLPLFLLRDLSCIMNSFWSRRYTRTSMAPSTELLAYSVDLASKKYVWSSRGIESNWL